MKPGDEVWYRRANGVRTRVVVVAARKGRVEVRKDQGKPFMVREDSLTPVRGKLMPSSYAPVRAIPIVGQVFDPGYYSPEEAQHRMDTAVRAMFAMKPESQAEMGARLKESNDEKRRMNRALRQMPHRNRQKIKKIKRAVQSMRDD